MKITVWVVSTCIPERGEKPCQPDVFDTEAEAEAFADQMLRNEWASNAMEDANGADLRYPGNWREANDQIAASHDDGSWGEWQITSHQVEIGEPNILALANNLTGMADEFRTDAERWRALMSSARMHFMGSAGFRHEPKDGDPANRRLVNQTPIPREDRGLHFGMEFWDVCIPDDRFPDTFERELLTVYVDAIRERSK